MDFQSMKRRELQALCKRNNIPANLTNAAMADSLSNLPTVEGLEEFLRDPTAADSGSPERSGITSSVPRTSTRQRTAKQEPEGSIMATRTRCGTRRRTVETTDTRKTPATRTTRKKAAEEATALKQTEKDLQAEFEADMEQSQVSDNSGLLAGESMKISEDVSKISLDCEEESLESQNESNNEVHEVVNEVSDAVDEDQEPVNSSVKVDFHSLNRRDLQSLCKKNKIPANTTNATMADALSSLEIVEGLEDFLKECNSQAPDSPTMSEMTSSCARRTWTTRRITKEPTSSKMITKSCRASRRKVIEEIDQEKDVVSETAAAASTEPNVSQAATGICEMESAQQREVKTYSRRTPTKDSAKKSGDTGEVTLPVAEVEKDHQGQLDLEKPEQTLDCVSETINELTQEAAAGNEFGEPNVDVSTGALPNVTSSEKDHEKGNSGLLGDAENIKDAIVADDISIGNVENKVYENVSEDMSSGSEVFSEDLVNESGSKDIQVQNVSGMSTDGSEDSDSGSVDESDEGEFENVDEDATTEGSDSEDFTDSTSESESVEDGEVQVSEKLDSKSIAQADLALASDFNGLEEVAESEPEKSQLTEMVIASSDSAAQLCPEQHDNNHAEEGNKFSSDTALVSQPIEKIEANYTISEEADSEPTIQADLCDTEEKETPLIHKSMRKLKKMLKEKTSMLAARMENLTLEEKDVPLAKVVEDDEESEESKSGASDAAVVTPEVDAADMYTVDKLMDNLVSEDSVSGDINVEEVSEKQFSMTPSKTMKTLPITPTKTPMSVGKMNHVSDVNKENVDYSASKTKSGNIQILSSMSMGKLKKALQEASEKKRPALQARSENCGALASP